MILICLEIGITSQLSCFSGNVYHVDFLPGSVNTKDSKQGS